MQDFLNVVMNWLESGQYTFLQDAGAWFIKKAVLTYLLFLYEMIPFAWGIAKSLLQDLQVTSAINSAWASLDPDVRAFAAFFKIPDALNIVLSGATTKFVMRFIPGF